jgi:hypothetical protein
VGHIKFVGFGPNVVGIPIVIIIIIIVIIIVIIKEHKVIG